MATPRPGSVKCVPIMTPRTRFEWSLKTLYIYVHMYIYICLHDSVHIFYPILFKFGKKICLTNGLDEFVKRPDPFIRFKMAVVSNKSTAHVIHLQSVGQIPNCVGAMQIQYIILNMWSMFFKWLKMVEMSFLAPFLGNSL